MAWKEYCAENWLKELQESMDRCSGHCDITGILLKMALNTIQSILYNLLTCEEKPVEKNCGKRRKSWSPAFPYICTMFSNLSFHESYALSASPFKLDRSEICHSLEGLRKTSHSINLYQTTKFYSSPN